MPEGSAYLGCYADSQGERALGEGFVWCAEAMTVPVSFSYTMYVVKRLVWVQLYNSK